MRLKIGFRVEGDAEIGIGHVVRCLSLAKTLTHHGHSVVFFCASSLATRLVEESGFRVVNLKPPSLHFEENGLKDEVHKFFLSILSNLDLDILVVDMYEVDVEWFSSVRPYPKKLVYVDGLNKEKYPVDIIINGNVHAERMGYVTNQGQQLLIGPKYNLLSPEFRMVGEKAIRASIKNILITTGGADRCHVSEHIVSLLACSIVPNDAVVNVVVGPAFQETSNLENLAKEYAKIVLHKGKSNLKDLMMDADVAISAGGSTMYELCACGTPTIAFVYADNQLMLVSELERLGCVISLGWYRDINHESLANAFGQLNSATIRKNVSRKMQSVVDGRGTERICRHFGKALGLTYT